MINLVLVQPEIPPNTGNIIRLCANCGAHLHLVGPMGFALDHAKMRRAGLDYHEFAELTFHHTWADFAAQLPPDARLFAITTRGRRSAFEVSYQHGDWLAFGSETRGLSTEAFEAIDPANWLRLPMQPGNRSMNLSNAAAVVAFEAWRQLGFDGGA
ncbi:MAG: tRNA (cytidine(34)-2'-O)-methyltransferase [Burkholderiaceae bacterium]